MRVSDPDPPAMTEPDATVVMIARNRRADQLEYHAPGARRANIESLILRFPQPSGPLAGQGRTGVGRNPGLAREVR
jgi:hypothetical protein